MSRIRILPESVANRIAAGEVVERPASVVKELVENAIDAGATEITVAIEDAGMKRIEVADDGEGMNEEDLRLSIERHATSKLATVEELSTLRSFGFRGEALPSIASVSRFEIRTALRGEDRAHRLTATGGSDLKVESAARTHGTSIVVRSLFYNTPARRSFLKSAQTEERQIRRAVMAHALAQRGIAFRYVREGEEIFHLPAGDSLLARVTQLFGASFAKNLVEVSGAERGPVVSGLVSNIDAHHGNRNYQYFVVNGRPVQQ
ncbi:MAG: DNA mismatch repair endonuclease MutL, partial [Gemmatimonadetes bacterium]|nr:DNA mismatch repair endonuclease MutL [Gemmatimonadota bacterium]